MKPERTNATLEAMQGGRYSADECHPLYVLAAELELGLDDVEARIVRLAERWAQFIADDERVINNPEATRRGGVMNQQRLMTVNRTRTEMLKELRELIP